MHCRTLLSPVKGRRRRPASVPVPDLGLGLSLSLTNGGDVKKFIPSLSGGSSLHLIDAAVSAVSGEGEGEGDGGDIVSQVLVGWPPVRLQRSNQRTKGDSSEEEEEEREGLWLGYREEEGRRKMEEGRRKKGNAGAVARFVKVNMDGVGIGRKVNLTTHHSYHTLSRQLEHMFFLPQGGERTPYGILSKSSPDFILIYEDKEGDWMLVGDIPWEMFLCTVKRLRIMKTSETNTFAPRWRNSTQASGLVWP